MWDDYLKTDYRLMIMIMIMINFVEIIPKPF